MISFDSYAKNVTPKGTYRFLEPDEPLKADDLARDLYPWSGSDYVDHDDFKRMNWAPVKQVMPAWVGHTLKEFGSFSGGRYRMEVIRKDKGE